MPDRTDVLLDIAHDLRIGLHRRAGEDFLADGDVVGGEVGPEIALALEGREGEVAVRGSGEPVGVDERGVGHGGAADGDVAFAEGGDEGGGDGGVVGAVDGVGGGEVADVEDCAGGEEFELGPVGGEGAEGGLRGGGEAGEGGVGEVLPADDGDSGVGQGAGALGCEGEDGLGVERRVVEAGGGGG